MWGQGLSKHPPLALLERLCSREILQVQSSISPVVYPLTLPISRFTRRSKFRSVCREASHPGRTAIPGEAYNLNDFMDSNTFYLCIIEPLRLSLALELPLDPEDSTKSSHSKTSNLVKLLSVSWLIDTICTHRLSTDSLDQHLIEATV